MAVAVDGLTLAGIMTEIQILEDGRIERLYQPEDRDLEIRIRLPGRSIRLRISADAGAARLHTVEGERPPSSGDPSPFLALARRRLEGGRVRYIRQVGMERIVRIGVESRSDLGDPEWYDVVVEIMGRHSNIILVAHEDDEIRGEEGPARGRVVDAIVRVSPGISRHRLVLPGRPYIPPPEQHKIDPREETWEGFLRWVGSRGADLTAKDLMGRYQGIGPAAAEEWMHRALKRASEDNREAFSQALWAAISQSAAEVSAGRFAPCIAYDGNGTPKLVSGIYLHHWESRGRVVPFETVNAAVATFYADRMDRAASGLAKSLTTVVRGALSALEHRMARWNEQLQQAAEADQWRRYGELVTAYLHVVPRGAREVTLPDPYSETGGTVTVPLDPGLSPADNAQQFFRRYQKLKRTLEVVTDHLEQARRDAEYLESVLVALEHADEQELEEIQEELRGQGFLRARRRGGAKPREKRDQAGSPMHFISSEGIDIFVGKNNRQNDELTTKTAHKQDTWLHAQNIPGSHVVIRSREVPPKTLEEAARLAAYYSKARHAGTVAVDYTLVKHVWKPTGARPGFVLYDHQKTVFVPPDPALAERLRADRVPR